MLVTFNCSHCSAKLRINANAMGSDLGCPECDHEIRVPEMSLGPGFVVGGFLIKHKIGQGGMGEVYLARQLSLERDVALKILPSQFTRENSFIVRFLKEVHYQAKMDHPNIVTAFDAGEDNGVYFMAMAYVSGETLEEWLDREGTMDEKDALQVVRQVAMALDYASGQKGILHRDIKPANVMVTTTLHAKVLDMGLSKNTLEKQSTTVADTLLGTPNYMSPEQIDHPQEIDHRADLFSLGMTLFHMLTGQVPYEDTSYLKTLKRHAGEKLPDPRTVMPGISPGASRLLARMLAREPDDRYPDWGGFLEDLQGVQSGSKIPTPPEGETTLDLQPLNPAKVQKEEPPQPSAPAPQAAPRPPSVHDSNISRVAGVMISVVIGLGLGLGGLAILRSQMQENRPQPQPTPVPIPTVPTSTPVPAPTPTPFDEAALQRKLTEIILDYERDLTLHDSTIERLVDLATEAGDSPIADRAAELIIRIRRERDTALDNARRRLREDTLRLLYEQGVDAARAHLEGYEGPFLEETETLRSNLERRIEIRARQEESQREADEAKAQELLQELNQQVAPLVIRKEWAQALQKVQEASEEPALFPVSSEVAELRTELLELQSVPELVIDSFERGLKEDVSLRLKNEVLVGEIVELLPDGIRVMEILYSEMGLPQGRVERDILFSELSHLEVLSRLEPHNTNAVYTYRALMLYHHGETEGCREELKEADSQLSDAIWNFLFRPIELPETAIEPEPLTFPQPFQPEIEFAPDDL